MTIQLAPTSLTQKYAEFILMHWGGVNNYWGGVAFSIGCQWGVTRR